MEKGKLIVIEGSGDGIGKSTQVGLLRAKLDEIGVPYVCHHFPSYGTMQGEPVSAYLKGAFGPQESLSPYFINNLYALDRAISWHGGLKRIVEEGKTLILDRYVTSSQIYQSALIEDEEERREFIRYVGDYEYEKLGVGRPDHVIFLHVPPEVSRSLRASRAGEGVIEGDIHESDGGFMKKVYDNSVFLADLLGWTKIECSRDGAMRPKEEIAEEVFAACGFSGRGGGAG
ncbi:MAG: thymidylate kinase [Clostridia bacterium]|nr:thymidylate kinase [Clostridia bacterium]